jgi:hypothetical protein
MVLRVPDARVIGGVNDAAIVRGLLDLCEEVGAIWFG